MLARNGVAWAVLLNHDAHQDPDRDKNRAVRWLVVGVGDITRKRVIPAILAEPRSELRSVLTRNPVKVEAYPGVRAVTSLEEAAADSAIDAVYIASPVALHAPQTIAFLRAGKHVLCEKPVALNFREASDMTDAAGVSGRLAGVAYYRRLYPKLIRAKELLSEGAVGQPVFGEANAHGWLESEERGWLRDPALAGGGPLYDTASHRIDAFHFLFGRPTRATGLRSNTLHQLPVEDSATVLMGFDNGVHATVDVRWNSRVVRDQFRIIGVEGEIDLSPLNGSSLRIIRGQTESREELPPHANLHFPCVQNFVEAILDGIPLACPMEEAIRTDWVTSRVCGYDGTTPTKTVL